MHRSRSHDAMIYVYDAAGNMIETHEHTGGFFAAVVAAASRTPGFRRDELHFVIIPMLAKYYANAQPIVGLHAYYRCQ
jgi:hypothetical protein